MTLAVDATVNKIKIRLETVKVIWLISFEPFYLNLLSSYGRRKPSGEDDCVVGEALRPALMEA